ncbi:helix-turn-helix domain-containing protein [Nocardia takedensis]
MTGPAVGPGRGVPILRQEFGSTDAGEVTDYIERAYVGNRTHFLDGFDHPYFAMRTAAVGQVAADHWECGIGYASDAEALTYLVATHLNRGRYRAQTVARDEHHSTEIRIAAGDCALHPIGVPTRGETHDLDMDMLRIPLRHIHSAAALAHGDQAADQLRFLAWTPLDKGRARYWRALSAGVHRELLAPDSVLGDALLLERAVAHLAAAALVVFPNTTMTGDRVPPPAPIESAALARAVDYLRAHPDRAVTVTEIATVAGVTARSLQYGFRAHYDTTPMEFHRRVRLEAAHHDLTTAAPDQGRTVAAIAARWGFAHPGRFAAYYQQVYGHPPGHTLRT